MAARVAGAQQGQEGPRGRLSESARSDVVDSHRENARRRGGRGNARQPVRAVRPRNSNRKGQVDVPREGGEGLPGSNVDRSALGSASSGPEAIVPAHQGDPQMVGHEATREDVGRATRKRSRASSSSLPTDIFCCLEAWI